ncbi:ArsR family transcriptional regulator [Halobacteria archaeon AArc-curdl1]|uniref:ArsR family transcriptional regulator n=1 Tax=Natronosalvus hydrolyticus TaxID=2979988 RepID=A0AAP2Z9J2_9EURY|nr:ArsR family transcriptional regulator [Halobacteria archaeon AArc-curdl1]
MAGDEPSPAKDTGSTGVDVEPAGLSPDEAFALIGHELRVEILRSLLEACGEREEYPTSFSTLRDHVGAEVSSQFSYHLEALVGHFIRRTEGGYELRYAGWEVATSVLAGTYTERAAFGPTSIDGRCPLCSASSLLVTYREEWLDIKCDACERQLLRYTFPPGGLESRTLEETLRAFDRHVRTDLALARDGICPSCTGRMRVVTDGDGLPADRIAVCVCQRCGNRLVPSIGAYFVDHERIHRFLHDGGFSREIPLWEREYCVSTTCTTVASTDPWRGTVLVRGTDRTLRVTVDETLSVCSTTVDSHG